MFVCCCVRGHGTRVDERGVLRATVCGSVERVNKLITVRPVKSRYTAEVGDVVVGVISEISGKRWKVDLNTWSEAILHLSAVNLPGGVQRRRTWEDELNMKNVFGEKQVLCAEVQSIHSDGSVALHTRSSKYGKLTQGQLIQVPSFLVKKQKQNFLCIDDLDVSIVLGYNGYVWVCDSSAVDFSTQRERFDEDDEEEEEGGDDQAMEDREKEKTSKNGIRLDTASLLYNICTVGNIIRSLAALHLPLTADSITQGVVLARSLKVEPNNIVDDNDFLDKLVEQEAIRRMEED